MAGDSHVSTPRYFQPVLPDQVPCPLQGYRNPLISGHSMVNILFCSFVIKRNSVSSEMLEVPYGERNIMISLSSSCIHVLTELLKPQGLCSQSPNQGKGIWEYSPETCSQKLDSGSHERHLTCAHPVWVHLGHVLSQMEPDPHNPMQSPGQERWPPTVQMTCPRSSSRSRWGCH